MPWVLGMLLLASAGRVQIPTGEYQPFYKQPPPTDGGQAQPRPAEKVPAFELDVQAVTADGFLAFVRANPKWQRSKVARPSLTIRSPDGN